MAIRFKRYQDKNRLQEPVRAIKITETNIVDIVNYITKRYGAATGHFTIPAKGKVKKTRPGRIRLRQLNFGENWGKRDWRVANVGDYIVMVQDPDLKYPEFFRVKADQFDDTHVVVK